MYVAISVVLAEQIAKYKEVFIEASRQVCVWFFITDRFVFGSSLQRGRIACNASAVIAITYCPFDLHKSYTVCLSIRQFPMFCPEE